MITDADILCDTQLRDEAIQAVEQFQREHQLSITPTQIRGLQQLASNQPGEVRNFAGKQRERAEKRGGKPAEIAFWNLVAGLCGTQGGGDSFRLEAMVRTLVEQQLADLDTDSRSKRQQHKHRLETDWRQRLYGPFFQHFCIHYCYLQSLKTGGGR